MYWLCCIIIFQDCVGYLELENKESETEIRTAGDDDQITVETSLTDCRYSSLLTSENEQSANPGITKYCHTK